MASAYGTIGLATEAQHAVSEANRLWPYATVRSFAPGPKPMRDPTPAFLVQMDHVQERLRIAGLRDHVDEVAEFGVPATNALHEDLVGYTPTSVPGALTIRTKEVVDLIERQEPLLIDVCLTTWGRSIPGAIGLRGSGHATGFTDGLLKRLERTIHNLARGDQWAPIVVFCMNAERFSGYNLVLRLVTMGYRQVYWYRGGLEAWLVDGLPESNLVEDWPFR